MKLNILFADVCPLSDTRLFKKMLLEVPPYRQDKISHYKFDKDKRLSLGVGLLLKRAMLLSDIPFDTLPEYTKNEKPYFPNYPSFHFNLSHSGHYVMCSFGNVENGCDVEELSDVNENLAKRVFTNDEHDLFTSLPNDISRCDYFFRIWTLKESYMKAIGAGLSLAPENINVELTPKPVLISSTIQKECRFFEFDFANDFKSSCCVLCGSDDIEVVTETISFA